MSMPGPESARAHERARLSQEERANLVAYLDNQLSPAESQMIAAKVAQSVTARREIEALKRSWELLDLLSKPEASPEFATKTLTSISMEAQGANQTFDRVTDSIKRWLVAASVLVGLAASLFLGYLIVSTVLPDPNRRLIRDLDIAEHWQEYQLLPSVDCVDELDRQFFDSEPLSQ